MIKLVVSDMDGTLISSNQSISKGNLEAIKKLKDKNIEFAIASGRDYNGAFSILKKYNIQCEAILGNGAQYVDKDGNILMDCYMNKKIIKDVVKIFEDSHIPYMIVCDQGVYTCYDVAYVRNAFIDRSVLRFNHSRDDKNIPFGNLEHIDSLDELINKDINIIKVEAFSLDVDLIISKKELLSHIPGISYLSSFVDNVEVTDKDAQKGYILEKVIQLKGLSKDEVMVLGDGMNDLSLFECFKYSFAPSNAEDTIKQLAYKVVSDCHEDGFKEAVDYMIGDD
jgi:hypothetical protein